MKNHLRRGIRMPSLLHIRSGDGLSYGGRQVWFSSRFARDSGCGPTAASNLLWYLAAVRPASCGKLFDGDARKGSQMVRLMHDVRGYITPGPLGLFRASAFAKGAVRYGEVHGVRLISHVLEVPMRPWRRPSADVVREFLAAAFEKDLPVAFLNRSNGALEELDGWHWVTLVALDADLHAEMYDQYRRLSIDVARWLETTALGGAFVALEPQN